MKWSKNGVKSKMCVCRRTRWMEYFPSFNFLYEWFKLRNDLTVFQESPKRNKSCSQSFLCIEVFNYCGIVQFDWRLDIIYLDTASFAIFFAYVWTFSSSSRSSLIGLGFLVCKWQIVVFCSHQVTIYTTWFQSQVLGKCYVKINYE